MHKRQTTPRKYNEDLMKKILIKLQDYTLDEFENLIIRYKSKQKFRENLMKDKTE